MLYSRVALGDPAATNPSDDALTVADGSKFVNFCHPGYPSDSQIFLSLPAFDRRDAVSLPGVHHGTALVACGVLAGNRWDGYFTRTIGGPAIEECDDDIIVVGSYYFYLPDTGSDGKILIL
jgi:hypothetical protein